MENIIFNEETHEYFLKENGELKKLISVTTLLKKHGLSPDYSAIPSATLNAKADYGKLVHGELENYIKNGIVGFSHELGDFMRYSKRKDLTAIASEKRVYNDIIAGTIDFVGLYYDKVNECTRNVLADFKTTTTLHKEAVRWQLSLYAYLLDSKIDCLQAFHFTNKGLKVVDIEPIPTAEIENLLECERKGEIYKAKQLVIADELQAKIIAVENTIQQIELQKKEAEKQADELKQLLLEQIRNSDFKSFENENLKITYIEATTRETIDSTRLKKELPEIAEQYKRIGNVKDSVRITLKKGKVEYENN